MRGAGTRKLFSVIRWLTGAASLAWVAYSLLAWLVPGVLCRVGDGGYCAEASNQALEKTPEDGEAAASHAARGCELGDATSCNNLGVCFQRGAGVTKSREAATRHYRQACELGSGLGCYNSGNLLKEEEGHAEEATAYFDRACELEWGPGCRAAVTRSAGVRERDIALKRAEQGCELADAPSCGIAALMLAVSEPRSPRAHDRLVQVTADCGRELVGSCTTLALLYAGGFGVGRDLARAHELLQRACRQGGSRACALEQQPELLQETLALFTRTATEADARLKVGP